MCLISFGKDSPKSYGIFHEIVIGFWYWVLWSLWDHWEFFGTLILGLAGQIVYCWGYMF